MPVAMITENKIKVPTIISTFLRNIPVKHRPILFIIYDPFNKKAYPCLMSVIPSD